MKWIKASERLPDKSGSYFCQTVLGNRLVGHYVYSFNSETKRFYDDIAMLHTGSIAWLDESPLSPSNDEDELWDEAIKIILRDAFDEKESNEELKSKFHITKK